MSGILPIKPSLATAALAAALALALFSTDAAGQVVTVVSLDDYVIQVDTAEDGDGEFLVQDLDAGNPTITVISADATTTTLGSTTTSITNNATVGGTLGVTGNTTLSTVSTSGLATLDSTSVTNNATVGGTLGVTGNTTLSTVSTSGLATLDSTSVTNNATVGGTLGVTGPTTLDGTTTVNNILSVDSNGAAAGGNTLGVDEAGVNMASGNNTLKIAGASNSVILTADQNSVDSDGRGRLRVTPSEASLTVFNSTNGVAHGVFIDEDSTVLTGGTTSTTLTLDDSGATFADTTTGGPARVTGVADGVNPFDAVNIRQLNSQMDDLTAQVDNVARKAYSGIASVAALAGIPGPIDNKTFSLGVGYGNYAGQNAVAFGAKASAFEAVTLTTGIGISNGHTTTSAGIGISW